MCNPEWWDRESDSDGNPIRTDVREAAQEIWPKVCRLAASVTGDSTDAFEMMELCVMRVSRYLDERGKGLHTQKTSGLLIVAFRNELLTRNAKQKRMDSIDDEQTNSCSTPSWATEIELRIDLDRLVRRVSERTRTTLLLREAGYEWKEIAIRLGITVSTAKNGFCRELSDARFLLHQPQSSNHRRLIKKERELIKSETSPSSDQRVKWRSR
jgi:DNA-directed RNA polymerase specialized sigma24 family protein